MTIESTLEINSRDTIMADNLKPRCCNKDYTYEAICYTYWVKGKILTCGKPPGFVALVMGEGI